MLHVDTKAPEDTWLATKDYPPYDQRLPGLRLKVRPVTPAMSLAARDAAALVYRKAGVWPAQDPEAEAAIPEQVKYDAVVAFTVAMAQFAIIAWEGIAGAGDEPLPVTPENIRAALRVQPLYDFFDSAYVAPSAMMDAEKNVSAPSQNGTSGAKTQAKATAATARRRARNAPTR